MPATQYSFSFVIIRLGLIRPERRLGIGLQLFSPMLYLKQLTSKSGKFFPKFAVLF